MGQTIEYFVDYWTDHKKQSIYPHYHGSAVECFRKIKSIEDIQYGDGLSTPAELVQFLHIIRDHISSLSRFNSYNTEFTPSSVRAKVDTLADLKEIAKEVNSLYIPDDCTYIFVKSIIEMYNPFLDIKFNFGEFKIKMVYNEVIVEPCGNNTKKDGYYHPYVKNHRLCLGEYKAPYMLLYNNMRFYDAWLEVKKCLTSYGGDGLNGGKAGPEHAMNAWVGFQCEVCKATMQPEDTVSCVKTKSLICKDCVNTGTCTDETTGDYYLPSFIKKCNSCGKNAPNIINERCLSCRMN